MSARLTAEDRRLRALSEADWQAQVLDVAAFYGWRAHHAPRAGIRRNGTVRRTHNTQPGAPDLLLVRGIRVVFAELKREGPQGVVSAAQQEWLDALAATSVEVYVFRPSDLALVEETLRWSSEVPTW